VEQTFPEVDSSTECKIPCIYGNSRLSTVFTTACYRFLAYSS